MRKLVVLLFPSENFVNLQEELYREEIDDDFRVSDVFDSILKKRYIDNDYDFIVINYKGQKIAGTNLIPKEIIYTDTDQLNFYNETDLMLKRYELLAHQIHPLNYSEIVIGGYHFGDCTNKLANAIYNINSNVKIDKELTNMFGEYVFNNNFEYNKDYVFYNEIISKLNKRKNISEQEKPKQL